MNISANHALNTNESYFSIRKAILLYSDNKEQSSFATVHTVQMDEQNRPIIGAGKPLTQRTMRSICKIQSRKADSGAEVLPANVLFNDNGVLIWSCKGQIRKTFFKSPSVTGVFEVPYPDLIFCVHQSNLSVYAIQTKDCTKERPSAETVLCHAPLMNIFSSNSLCMGNNTVPKHHSISQAIKGWETVLFDSTYTHPNAGTERFTSAKGGIAGLWSRLSKKPRKTFPTRVLNPIVLKDRGNPRPMTLGDLINKKLEG